MPAAFNGHAKPSHQVIRSAVAVSLIAVGALGVPLPVASAPFGMSTKDARYIADIYSGIASVLEIDKDKKISDTDRFRTFHAGCLRMAVPAEIVGKYRGLDEFIEDTFSAELGTSEVLTVDDSTKAKLIGACKKIAGKLNGI